jgi:hypothetical protein
MKNIGNVEDPLLFLLFVVGMSLYVVEKISFRGYGVGQKA